MKNLLKWWKNFKDRVFIILLEKLLKLIKISMSIKDDKNPNKLEIDFYRHSKSC